MSASTSTVPAQIGFGRLPSVFAALALAVMLVVAAALVVANGTKSTPAVSGAHGAAAPAFIDHGWSNGETKIPAKPNVIFYDHNVDITGTYGATGQFGGWGGPRLNDSGKVNGGHNGLRTAQ